MTEPYGPIPNQRVRFNTFVKLSNGKTITLPGGSYVKYVAKAYMPAYHPFGDYDEKFYVSIFTQYGMALIERTSLDWHVC